MYYHFYLSPFIFSCKESFNSSSFLKFEILISWASSPLGYAYYILIIYLEKLYIQFALLKKMSIFDTDRCQGKFYDIDRV